MEVMNANGDIAQVVAQQDTNDDLKRSTKMRNGDRPGNALHILR